MVCYGPTIWNRLSAEKAENLVKIHWFTEMKKITSKFYSICLNCSCVFFQFFQLLLLFVFFDLKKYYSWLHKFAAYVTFHYSVDFWKKNEVYVGLRETGVFY